LATSKIALTPPAKPVPYIAKAIFTGFSQVYGFLK
jgi:hypothetical protein